MIEVINGFNTDLEINDYWAEIYTYEFITIVYEKFIEISLPYKKIITNKYLNFELDRNIILLGISAPWNNLNEESSKNKLQFLLKNDNHINDKNIFTTIYHNRTNIKSGTLLGRIYFKS